MTLRSRHEPAPGIEEGRGLRFGSVSCGMTWLGSVWGRLGVDLGSAWGQFGVDFGSNGDLVDIRVTWAEYLSDKLTQLLVDLLLLLLL